MIVGFIRKDVLRELRTGELLLGGMAFGLLIVLATALARPVAGRGLEDAIASIWLSLLFVAQLSIARGIEIERSEGRWDAVLSSGADPALLYLAKVAVIGLFLLVTALPIAGVGAVLFNLRLEEVCSLVPSIVGGIAAFSLIGPLIVFLAAASRIKDVILPFLTIVLFVPVIVLSVLASLESAAGTTWSTPMNALVGLILVLGGAAIVLAPVVMEG